MISSSYTKIFSGVWKVSGEGHAWAMSKEVLVWGFMLSKNTTYALYVNEISNKVINAINLSIKSIQLNLNAMNMNLNLIVSVS